MEYEQRQNQLLSLNFILELLINIAIAVLLFSMVYFFIAQPHQIEGKSMQNTFADNDYVLTQKVGRYFSDFDRASVIVFKYPLDPSKDYIKRVIAVPGDQIRIYKGEVYINGEVINEPYAIGETRGNAFLRENEVFVVGEDEYIVMGDNRLESSDSREWGTVPAKNILGEVFFVYWPPNRLGFVK